MTGSGWTGVALAVLVAAAVSCDDETGGTSTGAGSGTGAGVTTNSSACAACEPGKLCCTTWGEARCITPESNPDHCGECDHACGGDQVCQNGDCVTAEDCSDAGACTSGECCAPNGICCPPGTQCVASVPDFMGCCPDEDTCTCTGADCPISRRQLKRDIEYLTAQQLAELKDELLRMRLATYRYRAGADDRTHLGFMLEDVEPSVVADTPRGRVDLYSYTSMAVATLQVQAREIEALRAELAELRRQVAARR